MERIVYVKKLMFLRGVCIMEAKSIDRRILIACTTRYHENRAKSRLKVNDSPLYDLLDVAEATGLLKLCTNMILNGHYYGKDMWRKIVWETLWALEDEECNLYKKQLGKEKLLFHILGKPYHPT